jgi:hypothetical protein
MIPVIFFLKKNTKIFQILKKNKRALAYYLNRKKSKWEIGRDYERYIGYCFEKLGCTVQYFGIEMKLQDLGRDLIVENADTILIIQCKYWSEKKVIHEKHIAQLFETTVKYKLDNPEQVKTIEGMFITSTVLSSEARRFADALGIKYREKIHLDTYPIIKCKRNKDRLGNDTMIYHLPLDQQYDTTRINPAQGDFYALTIEEAEAAGFRRAYKWHPVKTSA